MEAYLAEKNGMKSGFRGDLTGGQSTARISMADGYRMAVIISVAGAATDLALTLRQHDAETGGNSKDLLVQRSYFVKDDADLAFTRKEMPALAATITEADLNGAAGLMVVEVLAEDMDRDNGFTHLSADIAARAAVGSVIFENHEMRLRPAYKAEL